MILSFHYLRASPAIADKRGLATRFLPVSAENPAKAGEMSAVQDVFVLGDATEPCPRPSKTASSVPEDRTCITAALPR
jgi:hypothetical protein